MKINYVEKYKSNMLEFDRDCKYYIIEVNSKEFERYWINHAYLNEAFIDASSCSRISKYIEILNQIKYNPNNEIAYPIISHINNKTIKMSQGRHRIRAIIDSETEKIQLAIKKEYYEIFKKQIDINLIKELYFCGSK